MTNPNPPRIFFTAKRITGTYDRGPEGPITVEIETPDQPGVLRRITRAFAAVEVEVQLARLATEGKRVFDVFYVDKLDASRREHLERLIRRYLERSP